MGLKTKCPYCGYLATEHIMLDYQAVPEDGDISFCIKCGEISEFKKDKLIKIDYTKLNEGSKRRLREIEIAWLKVKKMNEVKKKK